MSSAISFDTLEYAKALEAKGFTTEQAEALAQENKRVFNEFAETQLATKKDLFVVKEELKQEILDNQEYLNQLENRFAQFQADLKIIQWGVGILVIAVVIPTVKALFS